MISMIPDQKLGIDTPSSAPTMARRSIDRIALHRGDDAGREGDEQRDDGGAGGEQERRRQLLGDEIAHRLLRTDRAPEVALRHPREPADVLAPERLVEAELVRRASRAERSASWPSMASIGSPGMR